jgi:hypothetical protein
VADVTVRQGRRFVRPGTALALLLVVPGVLGPALAAQGEDLERAVKAAFLYKFAAYAEWPAAAFPLAATPVRIGVLGDGDLAAQLEAVAEGRTIQGRPIVTVPLRDVGDAEGIHILFVGRSRRRDLLRLRRLEDPVLVVTESDTGPPPGAVVNFLIVEGRVRFDIDLDAAERRGLTLSSRLLAVAHSVRRRTP